MSTKISKWNIFQRRTEKSAVDNQYIDNQLMLILERFYITSIDISTFYCELYSQALTKFFRIVFGFLTFRQEGRTKINPQKKRETQLRHFILVNI